jgi:GNAT superfamily N-acetyltransferase
VRRPGGRGLRPPEPISATHDLASFNCGNEDLNDWLKRRALPSEGRSARTSVLCDGQRLAIALDCQGRGLGKALLKDAILKTIAASEIAGIRALVVHAIDDAAASFYRRYGFVPSPLNPRALLLPIETAKAALAL